MKNFLFSATILALCACSQSTPPTPTASPAPATATSALSTNTPISSTSPTPTKVVQRNFVVPDDLQNLAAFGTETIEGIFEIASLEIGVDISDIAFVPEDGGHSLWVETWEQDSRLEHWDIYSAMPVKETAVGEIFAPKSLSASSDGQVLVTADEDDVQLWDTETGTPIAFEFLPSPWLEEAAIAPQGAILAVGYSSADGTLVLIDLETGEDLAVFRHEDYVTDIDFSTDGNYLASSAANGSVKVIDIAGQHETFPYEENGWVDSVALEGSPPAADAAGHLLAISSGGAISLWDGGTGELHSVLGGHGSDVPAMDFSPNGELLASGGVDGELKLWDVVTGEELAAYFLEDAIRRIVFSSDGTLLAATTLEGPIWIWAVGQE